MNMQMNSEMDNKDGAEPMSAEVDTLRITRRAHNTTSWRRINV